MKLEISIFKFDCNSDYLPYYKKYFIKVLEEKNLLDLLNTINKEEKLYFTNELDFCICLNGLYTNLDISIKELKNNFSKELVIEPISTRRVHHDLLINDDDFSNRRNLFDEFITQDDKNLYETYKIYFYASNSIKIEKNYIGDALLLLADHLIKKDSKNESKILNVLKNHDYGITYHTSLKNKIYKFQNQIEENIDKLKEKLNVNQGISVKKMKINSKKIIDFDKFEDFSNISHDFTNFNIAYFKGLEESKQTQDLLDSLKAKQIKLEGYDNDLALNTFHLNENLSYKLASDIMLEAYDKSADLLVVDSDEVFYLMDYKRAQLKKISGRDILIPIIHKNELSKLAIGQHVKAKETLSKHVVNPELI